MESIFLIALLDSDFLEVIPSDFFHLQHLISIDGAQYTVREHMRQRLCKKVGVQPFGFHGIRHLAATILAYSGLDLPTVQAMLRHGSPATTASYIKNLGIDRTKIEAAFKNTASIHAFAGPKKSLAHRLAWV